MVPGRALVAPLSLLSILSVVSPGPVRCFQGQPSAGLLSRRTRPASSCASRAGYSSGGGARASGFARSGYVRGGTSTRWFTCTGASIGDAAGDSGRRQLELHTGATLKDAMREAIAFLESAGIEPGEADAGADILLGEITGLSRSAIRSAGSTRVLSDGELEQFRAMILRRGTREPVQYILGEWPFYNLERLKIRPPTLIPRPETEELVEMVLRDAAAAPARFLEVGPGSGAISLALLREWPNTRATAVDLCAHAVELSRENGVLTGLSDRITVEHAGISAWAPPPSLVQAPFDLLVSNPPYIPHAQMATLDPEVVDHEDSVALDGGDDGLDVVWEILRAAPSLLRDGASVWLEVDESHPELLEAQFTRNGAGATTGRAPGIAWVEWRRDLYGRPRFVHLRVTHDTNTGIVT